METKHKNLLIGGLLAIVLIMAVGYAAFATQLNISGTASTTANWDVHIESIAVASENGTGKNVEQVEGETGKTFPYVDSSDNLKATFYADLVAPGDSVTYTVVVKNGGDLNAKLSNITFNDDTFNASTGTNTETTTTGEGENAVTTPTHAILYSYSGIVLGDKIAAGTTDEFTVTVKYNPSVTKQPTNEQLEKLLEMQLTYVQDAE